jgi:hypothetical protein
VLIGTFAAPAAAQERRYGNPQGIPPGQMPRAGECRVSYDGRPPGRQPAPTSCRDAERQAARDPYARVIYGGDRDGYDRDDRGGYDRDDRGGYDRAIPRGGAEPYGYPQTYPNGYPSAYPNGYPQTYPNRGGRYGTGGVAFDNGYRDGLEKGREDGRKNRSYDPVRHDRYRDGDHGYDRRYGSKDNYKLVYRDGFEAGYQQAFRQSDRYRR